MNVSNFYCMKWDGHIMNIPLPPAKLGTKCLFSIFSRNLGTADNMADWADDTDDVVTPLAAAPVAFTEEKPLPPNEIVEKGDQGTRDHYLS